MYIIFNHLTLLIISTIIGVLASTGGYLVVPTPLLLLCGCIALLVYLMSQNPKPVLVALSITCCLGGAFLHHHRYEQWIQQVHFYHSYTLNIRGIITAQEEIRPENNQRITVLVKETQLNNHEPWQTTHAYITIYTTSKNAVQIGDLVQIDRVKCTRPNKQAQSILEKHGIVAQVYRIRHIQLLGRPTLNFNRLVYTFRQHIVHQLQEKLSPQTYSLFSTIFLGKRVIDKNKNMDDFFGYWGLNHYLARAGLHLTLLFLLLNLFTSLLMLPITKKAFLNICACTAYYCLTWSNIPFVRALTVIVGQQLCILLSIPIHSLHLLNIVFLTYVLYNPLSLSCLDTQLTFAITYAIVLAVRQRRAFAQIKSQRYTD